MLIRLYSILLAGTLMISVNAMAQTQDASACVVKILTEFDQSQPTSEDILINAVRCADSKNHYTRMAIEALCSPDGSGYSERFKDYIAGGPSEVNGNNLNIQLQWAVYDCGGHR
jgi:hypothetical protein